jgi:hypothetical protein
MGSVLMVLLAVEAALTVLAVGVLIWRGLLGMKEDDHLVLSQAEAHLEREQASIRARSNTLDRYVWKIGALWGILLTAIVSLWLAAQFL